MNKYFLLFLFIFCTLFANAQNNNSPYTIIGIGDIENGSLDRTAGMGNASIAVWSKRNLIQSNPASFARLEDVPFRTGFNFEVSARYNSVNYAGTPVTNASDNRSTDLQFKKACLAVKPKKYWAISLGLVPYSTANYSFGLNKDVPGAGFTIPSYIQGSGNTSLIYLANSFAINKHLSFGVQTAAIFGQFSQVETIASAQVSDSVLFSTRNYSVNAPFFKFGVLYDHDINKKWNVALGSTLSLKTQLNGLYDLTVINGNSTIKSNETYVSNYFTIPVAYAGGVSATYSQKYTIAADYGYQPWSNTNPSGLGYKIINSNHFSVGGEYANRMIFRDGTSVEKYFLQAGFYYNNSYLQIYGNQITDVGGTIGAGFNSLKNGLGMSAALQIGSRGTMSQNLIKENYIRLSVTISYRDFWRAQNKYKYD